MPSSYMPLARALQASGSRVTDALAALSIAEIRPSVAMTQLVDTVNELHAAVAESITINQLFVVELEAHDAAVVASRDKISEFVVMRAKAFGSNSEAYMSLTSQLLDEVRRLRVLAPPSIAACSIAMPRPPTTKLPLGQERGRERGERKSTVIKETYRKRHRIRNS